MKKMFCIVCICMILFSLTACAGADTESTPSSHVSNRVDEVIYVWHYYTDQYGSSTYDGWNLETIDAGLLMTVAREAEFSEEAIDDGGLKFHFCIRYYNNGTNDFFADTDALYIDLTGEATNVRADVQYWLSYETASLIMEYATPKGNVTKYARLSEETVNMLAEEYAEIEEHLIYSGI